MGIPFSCPLSGSTDLDDEVEALAVRSFSFNGEGVDKIVRTLSFNESDTKSPNLKSCGSGKMVIEASLSFKGSKFDPFGVETTLSVASPPMEEEDLTKLPVPDVSGCNNFEEASPKPCASHPDDQRNGAVQTTFSTNHPSSMEEDSTRTCIVKGSESNCSQEESPMPSLSIPSNPKHEAAVKLQKVYKSFRTRRQLADCAVLVEQRWWKLLDFALLRHSSISFFDDEKAESVVSRWSRARTRAARVGKGLSKNGKARKLALQHWLEAIDPRHRYGHNLHLYYTIWLHCDSRQPFFYWLDAGDGKEVTHERCSRRKLQQLCIKYLGPKEREAYEVKVEGGKLIYKQNRQLVDTSEENAVSKWIYVLGTSKDLYVGQKQKGKFHHSSFLAGGAASSAGRLVVEQGILKAIWPHSGHYRPTKENFQEFVNFLEENNVDLTDVERSTVVEYTTPRISSFQSNSSGSNSSLDLLPSKVKSIDAQQPDGLHHDASNASLGNLNDPSVELEGKNCCHASHVGEIFRDFETESDGELEIDDIFKSIEEFTNSTDRQNSRRSLVNSNLEKSASWECPTSSKYRFHKRNLFEGKEDENQEPSLPPELILRRINSMEGANSSELKKQYSFKWTSGTGPRISCVRDYPSKLQVQMLEQVSLSPTGAGNNSERKNLAHRLRSV